MINCLLQIHIATEETKFGLDDRELNELMEGARKSFEVGELDHVKICGLMGMASFSEDPLQVRKEFRFLKGIYDDYAQIKHPVCKFNTLSMGMSGDFNIALEEGSNMVRIGSAFFGPR